MYQHFQETSFPEEGWLPAHTGGPWPTYRPGNGFSTSREHLWHLRSYSVGLSPSGIREEVTWTCDLAAEAL